MSTSLINLKNIHKQFENDEIITKVLHGISFEIKAGEFISIMGPSGSGKSTLMNIMGFLDRTTSGTYYFKNTNVTEFDDDVLAEIRNKEIGFVFQSFNLLPRTSVLDNVILPLHYRKGLKNNEKIKMAKKAIDAVELEHRINNLSNQLSGGEKQRVAIARALVNDPSIIFADEPTGNLDSKTGEIIMKIFDKLNDAGKTIILVTHEMYTAEYADRIIQLRDGIVVSDAKNNNKRRGGLVK
jgi:putative ABC transport system ATP-binding protein